MLSNLNIFSILREISRIQYLSTFRPALDLVRRSDRSNTVSDRGIYFKVINNYVLDVELLLVFCDYCDTQLTYLTFTASLNSKLT